MNVASLRSHSDRNLPRPILIVDPSEPVQPIVEYVSRSGREISHEQWLSLSQMQGYRIIRQYCSLGGDIVAWVTWTGLLPDPYEVWTIAGMDEKTYHATQESAVAVYEDFLARHQCGENVQLEGGGTTFCEFGNKANESRPTQEIRDVEQYVLGLEETLLSASSSEYGMW